MQELEPHRNKSKMISSQILHTCTDMLRLPPDFFEVNVLVVEPPQRLQCLGLVGTAKRISLEGNETQIIIKSSSPPPPPPSSSSSSTTPRQKKGHSPIGLWRCRHLWSCRQRCWILSIFLHILRFTCLTRLKSVKETSDNNFEISENLRSLLTKKVQKIWKHRNLCWICEVLSLRTRMWCTGLGTHAQVHVR